MAFQAPRPRDGGDRVLFDAGTYPARLTGLYDLGHQDTDFGNKPAVKHQCRIQFVIFDDDKRTTLSKKTTLSVHEKSGLRAIMHALLGRKLSDEEAYELQSEIDSQLLGRPCLIEVSRDLGSDKKTEYNNLGKVMALPKGMSVPEHVGDLIFYEIEEDVPETFPEFIKKEIGDSREKRGVDVREAKRAPESSDSKSDFDAPPPRPGPPKSFDEFDPSVEEVDDSGEMVSDEGPPLHDPGPPAIDLRAKAQEKAKAANGGVRPLDAADMEAEALDPPAVEVVESPKPSRKTKPAKAS